MPGLNKVEGDSTREQENLHMQGERKFIERKREESGTKMSGLYREELLEEGKPGPLWYIK